MRDKDRIPKILGYLENIWEKFPDLRLGQLLCNVINFTGMYYVEDDQLIGLLCKFYNLKLTDIKEEDKPSVIENRGSKNMSNIGASNKGKVYVHKENDIRLINKDLLDEYLNNGYQLGRKDK